MKKIFLIIPSLHRGGAERVVSILANHLSRDIFDVTLILLEKRGSYLKDLHDDINIIDLKQLKVSKAILPLIRLIKKEKPDLVFSTLGHLNLALIISRDFMPKNTKFIAREASIPSILNQSEKYPSLFNFLYKRFYPKFDKIICQSEYMLNDLKEYFGIEENKMVVINNPVDFDKIEKRLKDTNSSSLLSTDKKNIIAVGSLESVKGYDLLIKAFMKVKRDNICLSIIGEGSLKNEFQSFIFEQKLEDRITLLGFQENPYQYMAEADLTVLTSKLEGFPNTVLESMACGTPVVAFKCPGGIEEIIIEGQNGWFVEHNNVEALAIALEDHLDNKLDSLVIKQSVYDRYNLNYIIEKYETLFQGVLNESA